MERRAFSLLAWALLALLTAGPAAAEARLALVVGNADYPASVGRLNNTHSDADSVASALSSARFKVTKRRDLNKSELESEIVNFLSEVSASPGAVAFFYYSGHGASLELPGSGVINVLVPAREEIRAPTDLIVKGVKLDQIIEGLAVAEVKAGFVVSDACRNELKLTFKKGVADKGFRTVAQRPGILIAYATSLGSTAPDDGVFAAELSAQIARPGQDASVAIHRALQAVARKRAAKEMPFMIAGYIPETLCFVTCPSQGGGPPPEPPPPQPGPSTDQIVFDRLRSDCEYAQFVRDYKASPLVGLAKSRAKGAKPCDEPAAPPPKPASPPPSTPDYDGLKVGDYVILGEHTEINGNKFWSDGMKKYVGCRVKITKLSGKESNGAFNVKVDLDGGTYSWRTRNMRRPPSGFSQPSGCTSSATPAAPSGSDHDGFRVGDEVILGKHTPAGASQNTSWAGGMDQYVGCKARIKSLGGTDGKPEDKIWKVYVDGNGYFWRTRNLRRVTSGYVEPSGCPRPAAPSSPSASAEYDGLRVGDTVILGEHTTVSGSTNWSADMKKYVGCRTTIASTSGKDGSGSYIVKVAIDKGSWVWRTRNMRRPPSGFSQPSSCPGEAPSGPPSPGSSFDGFKVGDRVILGEHTTISGSKNWSDSMKKFVGCRATITKLGSKESNGSHNVYVDIDGGSWVWRTRDMKRPPSSGWSQPSGCPSPGPSPPPSLGSAHDGFKVGDYVILGEHTSISGSKNWSDAMQKFVGCRTKVTKLASKEGNGSYNVHVDIDGGSWFWRTRDMKVPPASGWVQPSACPKR